MTQTPEILALLRDRYKAPEYAFLTEVSNALGGGTLRRADGLAMGLWKTRGQHLHGFEIKASRSDWLHEKKKPAKAESIGRFCDFWWLVTGDDSVCKADELPPTWGWLCVRDGSLVVKQKPAQISPDPLPRSFLAAIMRKVDEKFHSEAVAATSNVEYRKGVENGRAGAAMDINRLHTELTEQKKTVIEFERLSGVMITKWNFPAIADAVRVVMNGTGQGASMRYQQELTLVLDRARRMVSSIERDIECTRSTAEPVEYVI